MDGCSESDCRQAGEGRNGDGERVDVWNSRLVELKYRSLCRFCCFFDDRALYGGVKVARGEDPFQVRRGRMARCTSATLFCGAIGLASRGFPADVYSPAK